MADACNCLTCQAEKIIAAEVDPRGAKIEAMEIISLAVDLLASALSGLSVNKRVLLSIVISKALSERLTAMDAQAGGIVPTHEPEARVQ
ncbi:hypothetical protein [Ancylobacter sp.]|uniref:hypothetical protein n=1 Tax=Ancylobacter sp. TaxID=1872567 RepID=UPI003D0CC9BD